MHFVLSIVSVPYSNSPLCTTQTFSQHPWQQGFWSIEWK